MPIRAESDVEKTSCADRPDYESPKMSKHEPVKVVHGSGDSCNNLYYVSLYRYY